MKTIKGLFTLIGIVVVLAVIGVVVFMNTASDEDKKTILRETGLENSGIAREIAKESYLDCEISTARKNFLGDKWVINGLFSTRNETMNFTKEKIKFMFSDGYEIYNFSIRVNGSQMLKRPFNIRIPDHGNARFLGVEVVEVN